MEGTEEWCSSSISLTRHPSLPSRLSAVCKQKCGIGFNLLAQGGQALPLSIKVFSISAQYKEIPRFPEPWVRCLHVQAYLYTTGK